MTPERNSFIDDDVPEYRAAYLRALKEHNLVGGDFTFSRSITNLGFLKEAVELLEEPSCRAIISNLLHGPEAGEEVRPNRRLREESVGFFSHEDWLPLVRRIMEADDALDVSYKMRECFYLDDTYAFGCADAYLDVLASPRVLDWIQNSDVSISELVCDKYDNERGHPVSELVTFAESGNVEALSILTKVTPREFKYLFVNENGCYLGDLAFDDDLLEVLLRNYEYRLGHEHDFSRVVEDVEWYLTRKTGQRPGSYDVEAFRWYVHTYGRNLIPKDIAFGTSEWLDFMCGVSSLFDAYISSLSLIDSNSLVHGDYSDTKIGYEFEFVAPGHLEFEDYKIMDRLGLARGFGRGNTTNLEVSPGPFSNVYEAIAASRLIYKWNLLGVEAYKQSLHMNYDFRYPYAVAHFTRLFQATGFCFTPEVVYAGIQKKYVDVLKKYESGVYCNDNGHGVYTEIKDFDATTSLNFALFVEQSYFVALALGHYQLEQAVLDYDEEVREDDVQVRQEYKKIVGGAAPLKRRVDPLRLSEQGVNTYYSDLTYSYLARMIEGFEAFGVSGVLSKSCDMKAMFNFTSQIKEVFPDYASYYSDPFLINSKPTVVNGKIYPNIVCFARELATEWAGLVASDVGLKNAS